jgi:hypothetical protein
MNGSADFSEYKDIIQSLQFSITELSKRIDVLEKNTFDHSYLCLNILSLCISVIAIIVTIVLNDKNKKQNNQTRLETNLTFVIDRIDNAKKNFGNVAFEIDYDEQSPELKEIIQEKMNDAWGIIFAAYEFGCNYFYENKIEKQIFIDLYNIDIRNYIEDKNTKEYFEGPIVQYRNMLKFYDEYNKNIKARD